MVLLPGWEGSGDTTSIISPPRGMRKFSRPHWLTAGSTKTMGEQKMVVRRCLAREKEDVGARRAICRRRVGWVVGVPSEDIICQKSDLIDGGRLLCYYRCTILGPSSV